MIATRRSFARALVVMGRLAIGLAAIAWSPLGAAADDGCGEAPAAISAPAAEMARRVFERGACLADRRQLAEAREWFEVRAGELTEPAWQAAVANELGRIAVLERQRGEARRQFALAAHGPDPAIAATARLNLAALLPDPERAPALRVVADDIRRLPPEQQVPRLLALGVQAARLPGADDGLAEAALEETLAIARGAFLPEMEVQALDALAQLHESRGRPREALRLSDEALLPAGRLGREDLLLSLEWRRGRLLRAGGDPRAALAAYRRAADHLARIRNDIPIEYADGRSSFRTTFAPVYQELAELLLEQPDDAQREERLRLARLAVERIKQSELEDYLGDRCVVESSLDEVAATLPDGTVVLYPVMLPERLELLIQSRGGIQRVSVAVGAELLGQVARRYARDLRTRGWTDADGERLHDWLLAPVEALFGERLKTLVVVPDAGLRLVPFASLRSGGRYVIERYAVGVVPGLAIAGGRAATASGRPRALLAGLAAPGEVVAHLPNSMLRSLAPAPDPGRNAAPAAGARVAALKVMLALPGVRDEIAALERLGLGTVLLDQDFSVAGFERALQAGDFGIVHIASHGVFGGSAENTFLMAHNDIITMGRLQQILSAGRGIDLLTLSACETAEGDDRAPLGLAGAALRSRARSALGSLWPVADDAARLLMEDFYRGLLAGLGKAEALRAAQLALLAQGEFSHPFYWAPFVLVGDWQ